MNKQQFLEQEDVSKFINWLILELPGLPIHLDIKTSPFNPIKINTNVKGLPSVLQYYSWKASWVDESSQEIVNSTDWDSTNISLELLSNRLRLSIDNHDEQATLKICFQILKWGGVKGAVRFLKDKASKNLLVKYLNSCRPFFDIASNQNIDEVDANLIQRFDAGMTKIHSLLDKSGSPIYDSRVGAAIAMLYQLYKKDCDGDSLLEFPSGSARGSQIRDPSGLGFKSSPQFYTNRVKPYHWAQYQIKLGWIIELLAKQNWFTGQNSNSIPYQCRAIEACLFMVGYDIRALVPQEKYLANNFKTTSENKQGSSKHNWVPTGHPFIDVLNKFLEFKKIKLGSNIKKKDFKEWLVNNHNFKKTTALAYCYPLNEREFDLWDSSIEELEILVKGGKAALDNTLANNQLVVDERVWVCLYDAFIVGVMNKRNLKPEEMQDLLISKGIAGTKSAVNTLKTIGKQVGIHFGLLNNQLKPTNVFYETFGDQELEMLF